MNREVLLPCSTFVGMELCPRKVGTMAEPKGLQQGAVAEWLGRGLQNLLQRFESAQRLKANPEEFSSGFFNKYQRRPWS